MKRELLIAKLDALAKECQKDFPAISVILNITIATIYADNEVSLMKCCNEVWARGVSPHYRPHKQLNTMADGIVYVQGDITFLYRDNSTGNPTLKHILCKTGKTYCGFDDTYYAEVHALPAGERVDVGEICKKCLKGRNKDKISES